jgi:uncharacterized protein
VQALPSLGLGLSSNAQVADVPRPYELLRRHPDAFDYLEYSAPLDVDAAAREATLFPEMLQRRGEVPLVFHPVHLNLYGPQLESPGRLAAIRRHCELVQSPWVSNDVAWWHHGEGTFPGALYLSPPLTPEALSVCVRHAHTVRDAVGVPLLLENPTVPCARGPLHVLDFMERLSRETDCWLLLDVGHLLSHQLTRGNGLLDGLEGFDFGRVAQLHVAGGVITTRGARQHYVDDHPQPVRDEVWELLSFIAPRCRALRALTFEADGHPDAQALRGLARLRPFAPPRRTEPARAPAPRLASGPFTLTDAEVDACWQLFDDVHAGRGQDVEGARAELDFRLAVLAQQLDAEVPWARLAAARTREALATFQRSAAFRSTLAQAVPLAEAFLAWAETSAQTTGHGPRRLLDFERALRRHRAAPVRGPTGLGPGVTVATFDVDFAEVVFAAQALRRHLNDRAAWSTDGVEGSGLEGVLQAAARAPAGPWTVALRRVGLRVEVHALSGEELAVLRQLEAGASVDVAGDLAARLLRRGLVTRSGR